MIRSQKTSPILKPAAMRKLRKLMGWKNSPFLFAALCITCKIAEERAIVFRYMLEKPWKRAAKTQASQRSERVWGSVMNHNGGNKKVMVSMQTQQPWVFGSPPQKKSWARWVMPGRGEVSQAEFTTEH